MTVYLPPMNGLKLHRFLLVGFFVAAVSFTGCKKDTYEVEIERFYYKSIKGSVSITKITVDTTVTFEQAKPWLDKKLERVKERLKKSYEERYNDARSSTKSDPSSVAFWKARLDSANAGLFSPDNHEIKSFSSYLTDKPYYEQVTLRYKVWVQGEVREQVFIRKVTSSDTTLNVTEKGLKEYLQY